LPGSRCTGSGCATNGLVLIALSVAIVHSGFSDPINLLLALLEVTATVLSDARNVLSWRMRLQDGMADIPERGRRLRGLGNVIHFVVVSALLYGVTRTSLGL
jgi:hypothetical protein